MNRLAMFRVYVMTCSEKGLHSRPHGDFNDWFYLRSAHVWHSESVLSPLGETSRRGNCGNERKEDGGSWGGGVVHHERNDSLRERVTEKRPGGSYFTSPIIKGDY